MTRPLRAPGRRRLLRAAGAAPFAAAATLAGCGFRLRGNADLPFQTLYTTFSRTSALGEEFRRELERRTSTRIVDQPDKAQVRLLVIGETRERDIVAYSVIGRPREFQLRLRLQFRADDGGEHEFIAPSEIILRRDISAADNQLTARVDEEALLYRDMQKDMVQQLLRRLAAIRMTPATAPAPAPG
ncbi:MAG: LPS assembly lipoprotein LptE [Lautropia sp.]